MSRISGPATWGNLDLPGDSSPWLLQKPPLEKFVISHPQCQEDSFFQLHRYTPTTVASLLVSISGMYKMCSFCTAFAQWLCACLRAGSISRSGEFRPCRNAFYQSSGSSTWTSACWMLSSTFAQHCAIPELGLGRARLQSLLTRALWDSLPEIWWQNFWDPSTVREQKWTSRRKVTCQ